MILVAYQRQEELTRKSFAPFLPFHSEGIFAQLSSLLRGQVRENEGREAEPSVGDIDSQSVKTSTNVPLTSQGIDPGKKIVGRKRNILTNSIGLLLAVMVTAATWSSP